MRAERRALREAEKAEKKTTADDDKNETDAKEIATNAAEQVMAQWKLRRRSMCMRWNEPSCSFTVFVFVWALLSLILCT